MTSDNSEPFVPEYEYTYQAEDGIFSGEVCVSDKGTDHSGTGYVTGFYSADDKWKTVVDSPDDGFYDLVFSARSTDHKENNILVDGVNYGSIITEAGNEWTDCIICKVFLEKGEHEISAEVSWGWFDLDKLTVRSSEPIDPSVYNVSARLCNPDASDEAKRLMSYLCDVYGDKILSGQYSQDGQRGKEFFVVSETAGKKPAVLGLDLIDYTPSRVSNGTTSRATDFAIDFWNDGGIVTFCWHWNAPEKYLTGVWYSGFYTEHTDIDLDKIMNGQDPEGYDLLMRDMDAIAQQLVILRDAGVPVLWRPLHEASGGWFWWGSAGSEAYKKLYILMYEKLTGEYGLNNLIWVWNGQSADWYPGDEYVDIIGSDIYPGERQYGSQIGKYLEDTAISGENKMIILSENGCVPDPALMVRDGAMWGLWCTWGAEFVARDSTFNKYSEQYTEADKLREFYSNDAVITLDELPDLKSYPIRKELK
ncbi:MAG: beta-mannosidase [Lachnospiraceae bacterium]|nr:beta-mannosidase [Lachnospiraceae bacterium]